MKKRNLKKKNLEKTNLKQISSHRHQVVLAFGGLVAEVEAEERGEHNPLGEGAGRALGHQPGRGARAVQHQRTVWRGITVKLPGKLPLLPVANQ